MTRERPPLTTAEKAETLNEALRSLRDAALSPLLRVAIAFVRALTWAISRFNRWLD